MQIEEGGGDAGNDAVPAVDLLVGGLEEVDRGVERLEGEEVLEGPLRDGDEADSFCQVEVVYGNVSLVKTEIRSRIWRHTLSRLEHTEQQ